MIQENISFSITDRGRFKIVTIHGDILRGSRDSQINLEIQKLTGTGTHFFIFNLENVTYLDSSGISIFIHCLCDVQENKGAVYIIAKDPHVREVIELVGLNRLIQTYSSFEELEHHHVLD